MRNSVHGAHSRTAPVTQSLLGLLTSPTGITACSFAICVAFAAKGCRVFASARRLEALEALPSSVERLVLDVTDLEACRAAVDEVIQKAGKISILVNNAGAGV